MSSPVNGFSKSFSGFMIWRLETAITGHPAICIYFIILFEESFNHLRLAFMIWSCFSLCFHSVWDLTIVKISKLQSFILPLAFFFRQSHQVADVKEHIVPKTTIQDRALFYVYLSVPSHKVILWQQHASLYALNRLLLW